MPSSLSAAAPADLRFGLIGAGGAAFAAKFGLAYYTLEGNYGADKGGIFSSVDPLNDPAAGFSVVREVAKLNVRTDGLGETNAQFQATLGQYTKDLASWYALPSWARGAKPVYKWYSPDAAALANAESLQIVTTIRREKARNPAITGTVWEIGNDPNLFPAILPAEYAAIVANYTRIIKGEDPGAVVAMGALFLPEPSEDLKARFGEELEARMKLQLQTAGLYNTLNSLGLFTDLVADVRNTVLARTLALPAREYLRQVLEATPARPDIVTVHAYPYDDRAPFLDSAALKHILDTTFAGVASMSAGKGVAAAAAGTPFLWITEFGNIEQALTEDQVARRTGRMAGWFQANPSVGRWFHYKSTGADDQFALFSSGPAPLTRLSMEADFSPADGNFACARLNAVGRTYWRLSHGGGECLDSAAAPKTDSGLQTTGLLARTASGTVLKSAYVSESRRFLMLRMDLGKTASVRVQILDASAHPRRTLYQGRMEAGDHAFPYDRRGERGRPLQSGIYFCRFQADGDVRTIPVVIMP